MMTGWIKDQKAFLRVILMGMQGDIHEVDAVIDTGFSGYISLPQRIIDQLEIPWDSSGGGILANGVICTFEVYLLDLMWDGRFITVPVYSIDSNPLIGMKLLDEHEIRFIVRDGEKITIQKVN